MQKDTRTKIMDAAKMLFSENGFAAVTTKEIAKSSHTSEVTLFRYFHSKRNLFNAIVKEQMQSFNFAAFIKNDATYDVRHDLTYIAQQIIKSAKENSALLKMIIKDAILNTDAHKHSKSKMHSDWEAVDDYFKIIKEKGLIYDDAKKLMIFFMSNINAYAMRNYILKEHTQNNKEDTYLEWLISKVIDTILMPNDNFKERT